MEINMGKASTSSLNYWDNTLNFTTENMNEKCDLHFLTLFFYLRLSSPPKP